MASAAPGVSRVGGRSRTRSAAGREISYLASSAWSRPRSCLHRGGGQDGNLHVHPPRPLQVHLDEIGPRRGEHPHDAAAVRSVGHLLRDHGVEPAGEAAVARPRLAPSERLVRLVHEDDAPPQRPHQAEDLRRGSLRGAHPPVPEVLELHHRHARLAGEALDQEGLAGPDRSADEIAHGQGAPDRRPATAPRPGGARP